MRKYELTVIFAPVLRDEGLSKAVASVEALVKKLKGKVVDKSQEGKQSFSYPIAKYHEGIYVFWNLELPSMVAPEFEDGLKHQKGVLRQLLVRIDK